MFEVALGWYLALLAIGGAGLLPATLLFPRLRSRGALYARPLALVIVAQVAWLTAALTSIPYGLGVVAAALAALYGWSAWLAWREPGRLRLLRDRWSTLVAGEALFLGVFMLVALVRAQAPAATATEKPMDLMLLTVVHGATAMPPPDAWLAGFEVSYYHLGHVMVDVAQRLTGIGPAYGFNLGLAAAAAMAATAAAGLATDVVGLGRPRRRSTVWIAAGLAVVGLIWLAPLEGLAELAAANGLGGSGFWGTLGVAGLPGPAEATHWVPDAFWWWWRASRVVPGTISEFPAFSFILGDLHAHVLALPLGLLALALSLDTFEGGTALTWRRWTAQPGALLLAGALFAGLAMTNTWDVVTYGLIWLAAATWVFTSVGWPPGGAIFGAARYLAVPAGTGLLIAWPMLATFQGERPGLALVTDGGSDPVRFLLFWGAVLVPVAVAAALDAPTRFPRRPRARAPVRDGAGRRVGRRRRGRRPERGPGGARRRLAHPRGARPRHRVGGRGRMERVPRRSARPRGVARDGGRGGRDRARDRAVPGDRRARARPPQQRLQVLVARLAAARDRRGGRRRAGLGPPHHEAADRRRGQPSRARARSLSRRCSASPSLLWLGALLYAPAAAVSRAQEGQDRTLDALAYLDVRDPGAAAALRWVRDEPRR